MSDKSFAAFQKENAELIKENEGLKETVTKLLEELDRIRQIERTPTDLNVETREQALITQQIERYESMSKERLLTLEEIRAFDLLVKNKKILEPEKKKEPEWNIPDGTSETELLLLAGGKEEKKEETKVEQSKSRRKSKAGSKDPVA